MVDPRSLGGHMPTSMLEREATMPTKEQSVKAAHTKAKEVAGDLKYLRDHMADLSPQETVDEMEMCVHEFRTAAGRLATAVETLQKEIDG